MTFSITVEKIYFVCNNLTAFIEGTITTNNFNHMGPTRVSQKQILKK